jgi:5-methylcytosine-specific restriction endonuclease McrA
MAKKTWVKVKRGLLTDPKHRIAFDIDNKLSYSRVMPRVVVDRVKQENTKCEYCGSKENLEIDHIIPVARGGGNTINNLQILCRACNKKKADKMPESENER